MQLNLNNHTQTHPTQEGTFSLTDKQKADIIRMVGNKCRQETKARLSRRLDVPLSCWESFGIYSRMTLDDKGADYICGQSWPDEMRTLRECILR